ncbi:glutaredoxin family protein [Clostridium sp. SYSU_GA19001]|uniref:glutaredoxin family protein n=1 Tax=Clostridium caldaquaticum TaxID=2940653 RepID=UPI0020772CC5|nr:glutaredoxin family protein [Clostridium caldaquaticum]MCM8709471.1 glutaredoxin family protein [Clostridium caldaquaticum]
MKNVIVYTSNNCIYCSQAKEYLKENGVAYQERNIQEPNYRKELMAMKIMSVPVLKIDDEVVVGFNREKIDSLLGL